MSLGPHSQAGKNREAKDRASRLGRLACIVLPERLVVDCDTRSIGAAGRHTSRAFQSGRNTCGTHHKLSCPKTPRRLHKDTRATSVFQEPVALRSATAIYAPDRPDGATPACQSEPVRGRRHHRSTAEKGLPAEARRTARRLGRRGGRRLGMDTPVRGIDGCHAEAGRPHDRTRSLSEITAHNRITQLQSATPSRQSSSQ